MTSQEIQKAYRIARSIASKLYRPRRSGSMEIEDLQQAGVLHLWRRRGSPRPGHLTWTGWAGQIIRYGILEALRQEDLTTMSPEIRKLLGRARQTSREMQQKLLREPTARELIDALGIDDATYNEMTSQVLVLYYESDGPIGHTDRDSQVDSFIVRHSDDRKQPDEACELLQQAQMLRAAVKELPNLQRVGVEQALFLGRAKKDIAQAQGVSQSSVSQALRLGVQKLTERMKVAR